MSALSLRAQQTAEYRQFKDKQGRTLDAQPVSVSPDRKTLKLRLRDGKDVDLEIVLLSLDDQQFLREWVATQPMVSDFRLQVAIEKVSAKPSERRRTTYYKLNTESPAYRIRVTNLSRETLAGAELEYFLLTEEGAQIYLDSTSGDWTYNTVSDTSGVRFQTTTDTIAVPELPYNRQQEITTKSVTIDQVMGDGNLLYGEDKLVGLIMQIRDDKGNVVDTWRSADTGIAKLDWEDVEKLGNPDPTSQGATVKRRFEVAQGESSPGAEIHLAGRSMIVRCRLTPDALSPDGVVAAQGDEENGWLLRLVGSRIHFTVKVANDTKTITAALPRDIAAFDLDAELNASEMELSIDGTSAGKERSPGLFAMDLTGDLTVGNAAANGWWTAAGLPTAVFAGKIEDFTLRLGSQPSPVFP